MKNKFLPVLLLCFWAIIFSACTNILGEEKKSSDSKGIVLSLPYAKSNKTGVFRAGDDAANSRPLNFKVTFTHKDSGTETPFEGKSGEKIIFENAPVGFYTIYVQGYDDDGGQFEGNADAEVKDGETTTVVIKLKRVDGIIEINLLGWTDEQARMIEKYIETHSDCGIHLNYDVIETTNGKYTTALDSALTGKSTNFVPDIYCAEAGFVLRYTQGGMSSYALPYSDFISNLDTKISDAEIAQYTVDLGTNKSNKIVGMAYQTTGGAFVYRRSVAKTVFGTDDSDTIKAKIGGGSGEWTKFWEAAASCADKGVAIVSGDSDLWHPVESSAEKGWIVDGQLHIDSNREAFLDYSKDLWDNGWSNKTTEWTDAWNTDAGGKGEKPVLGFFGPAWLINYVLEPACDEGDNDWAICESPVGFFWGGTWMLVNKDLKNDKTDEGKKKLEAVSKIIEWITLDATEDGLQYQWANGMLDNAKDTVASKVVMDKSDGTLDFLGGINMFDYYVTANNNARVDLLTEYDDKITAMWRFEVNKYAEGLTTREQALNNFKYAAYSQLGLQSDDFDAENFVYETEHVRAESAPDGKGIMFTLTAKEGESWVEGASFIWESVTGIGIRIRDVPTPGNPKVCYWPLTDDGKGYEFNCDLRVSSPTTVREKVYAIAKGGSEYIDIEGENVDISLSGTKLMLSKDLIFNIDKSDDIQPYLSFDVYTTSKKDVANPWDVDWKQWLNSGHLDFSDNIINTLKNDGYQVLNLTSQAMKRLEEDKYYFVNLTLEFTIDGYPESFRSYAGAYSPVYEYNLDNLVNTKSDHITAEPDPAGKGIKFTISAKNGEEWRSENLKITELSTGVYMEIQEKKPTADKPIVCYWPFTKDGETYMFDCEVKLVNQDTIHETLSATANGKGADLNIDFDALSGLGIDVNSTTGIAKVTKDITSAISYSENVIATFDIGSFSNDSPSSYKWTQWLSTRFIDITDPDVYSDGAGISLFSRDRGTVEKLKKDKYFFTNMELNFEIEGIDERYRYGDGYRTAILDASNFLGNLNTNTHISAEPCDEGIKITLRYLESDGEWRSGYVNNINCLTADGENGVAICLCTPKDFDNGVIPDDENGNRSPTADEAEVEYIYPFTVKDKEYEFEFAGPIGNQEEWQHEYVCCKAGGGVGELIDADEWNKNVMITDIVADAAKNDFSFRVTGDVASIIDNSTGVFSSAEFWPDVRPGVAGEDDVDHRGKILGYASRRVILVGEAEDYNRGPEAFNNPFVIENNPEYEAGNLNEDAYDNENVFDALAEWDNTFYVIMSIQRIKLNEYPDTIFYLHWK